jgi:signal transduction histidine kinase
MVVPSRRPAVPRGSLRTLLVIAVAGAAYCSGLAVALHLDWHPQGLPGYVYLGVIGILGAATVGRWPLETLAIVTGYTAYTTLVSLPPELYGLYVRAPESLVPLGVVAFLAIAGRGPVVIASAVFGTMVVLVITPWRDILANAVSGRPLGDVLLLDTDVDRSLLFAELVACTLVVLVALMLRRQRRATAELAAQNRELIELRAAEVVRIAERERTRIARDLHDEIAHHVAALVIRAQAALRVADRQPEQLSQAVADIAEGGQDVLVRIRRVVRMLKAAPLDAAMAPRGLAAELDVLFARVRGIGYEVAAVVHVGDDLPAAHRSTIVGVVQESLTNAMLHSAAHDVCVTVEEGPRAWTVTATDPGPARERFPDVPGGGSGIPSLHERVGALGGRVTAGPAADGAGWTVHAELPRTIPSGGREEGT